MKGNYFLVLWTGIWAVVIFSIEVKAQNSGRNLTIFESRFTVERTLTTEEGLPANGVNKVIEDSQGYMWAATYNGLVRYDGQKMRIYNRANVPLLQSNRFLEVMEDSEGRIWAGLEYNNLILLEDETIRVLTVSDTTSNFNNHITSLSEAPDGKIWIGTNHGVFIYEENHFRRLRDLKSESVQQIIHTNDYTYLLFQSVLYRLFPDGDLDKELLNIDEKGIIKHPNYEIREIAGASFTFTDMVFWEGNFWLLSHGGLVKINESGYELIISAKEINQNLLHGFYFNNAAVFVYGTHGLVSIRGYETQNLSIERFSDKISHDMLIDGEGSIWLATGTHGLHQFVATPVKLSNTFDELSGKAVTAILQSRESQNLYVGTNCDGLYEYTKDETIRYSAESGIDNNCVWSLMEQRDGTLWVGTWGRGVFYRPKGAKEFLPFTPQSMVNAEAILSIYEDKAGTIWFGTYYNGLFRKKGETVERVFLNDGNLLASVRSFYEDKDGHLWITTDRGVVHTDVNDQIQKPEELKAIDDQNIRVMAQDSSGRFWFGSYGGGLFTYKFGGKLTSITNENGLLDDTISQLVFDKEGDLWLAGNLGVFQIEKSQLEEYLAGKINRLKVSKLGVKEGLPIRETTGGFMPSSFLNDEGVLFIPTMQGLAEIHTNRMKVNRSLPNVVIEEIEIDGEIHSIYDLPKITYKDQRFVFKFATLSFQNPANVQFQYMLEGFDKSWQVGDGVLEVVYTSLSPGDYTLRIKAANNDGFWNEEGASFTFNIEPPFWETIWFYSLLVILFFSSVYGFTQYRMRLLQKREKNLTKLVGEQTAIIRKEKELLAKTNGDLEKSKKLIEKSKSKIEEQSFLLKKNDQVKSMFFANISQELRTPLTLIKGILEQNLKAQKSSNKAGKNFGQDLAKMASYANRLQSQVNYLLELSKVETGDVSLVKKVYDLNFQVSLLGDLFQTLSSENEVDFSFELAANPILIQADPGKIEKVILSLFIKFLHYTDKTGWIQMSTSTEKKEGNDWAQFTMESSKTGISEEEKFLLFNRFNYQTKTPGISIHSGFALVKEWVNLHGGELVLDSVEANNLKIQILLPQLVLEAEDSKEHINVKASREIIDIAVNPKDIPDNSQALFDEHKKTVLLIEDSLPVRIYTRELLKKDYNILEAGDAVKGMEIIFNKDPKIDLVISDLMMPEMDGYELCRKLRKHPDTSTIPFILLTAKAGEDSYLDGIKSGIDAFITKPFNENVLKETVKRLVENRDRLLRQFMDKESLNLLVAANDEKDTLLNKVDKLITENMEDAELSVETLALWLHMSPRQLQRNLKEATGLTPIKYLRKRRLEAARHLIEQDYGTISEVAYAVGFNTLSLFSSYFKKEFGKLPSDWHKTNNS